MKHFEDKNAFDKGLKSMNHKFRISEKEQKDVLNEINMNIDRNVPTQSRKSSKWKYYIASIASVFILVVLAIALFSNTYENLAGSDELSGQTFTVSYPPVLQEDIGTEGKYTIMTLEFSDGNVVTNTIYGAGTYELNDDVFVINYENENESLEIKFTDFKESDKDFSEYSAIIGDMEYQITDSEKVRYLTNLYLKFSKGMSIEFIKK